MFECGGREDVLERRGHGGDPKSVPSQRPADAPNVAVFQMNPPRDALGDFFRATVRGARYATADGFSEDEKVGRKFPRSCASARASADGVGFIGDEQRAVAPGERL